MILRAFLWCLPRFFVLLIGLTVLQEFEFSPLPVWTGIVVAYAFHFVITYTAARWSFARQSPSTGQALGVAAVIVLFGTFLEAVFVLAFHRWQWSSVWTSYHWQSLYLVALYLLAVWFAAQSARRKNRKEKLPEGMAV